MTSDIQADVLICGGGMAGTMAAITAGRAGADTLLAERRDPVRSVCGHDIAGEQVVDRQPVSAHEVADASAEGEPADAGMAHDAAGRRQPEKLALAVEMLIEAATLHADAFPAGVDARAGHEGKVDDHAAVAHRVAGDGMRAASHCDEKTMLTCKKHRGHNVRHAFALCDQIWPPIDIGVPHFARRVVARITRADQVAEKVLLQHAYIGHRGPLTRQR